MGDGIKNNWPIIVVLATGLISVGGLYMQVSYLNDEVKSAQALRDRVAHIEGALEHIDSQLDRIERKVDKP